MSAAADIHTETRRNLGIITLNRPQALNALSLGMVRQITATLLAWRDDAAVSAVMVRGAERDGRPVAFCAGGDIRYFHLAALAGDPTLEDFFTEEYQLNHLIHHYPKPYIALMDGVVMGGGMGIAQGGPHPRGHRAHQDGHARDQHRAVSRCGRRLLPVALPGRGG